MSERHHQPDPVQGEIVHEYDGILEADNMLPRWWLGIFFGSIVFAFGYWFVYESWHMLPSQSEIHAEEMARAAESGAVAVDDSVLDLLAQSDEAVSRGREAFQANCVACHGDRGQGVIGPNLTDGMWKHGGAPTDIYRIVREGYQAAGMPPWGPALGERQVQSVVAYVLTLRDTNVPGRDPEGEPWVPGAAPTGGDAEQPEEQPPAEAEEEASDEAPAPGEHAAERAT